MNIEDYVHKKSGRGYKVQCQCLNCEKEFWVRWSSVKSGGGKYCSYECNNQYRFYNDPELQKYEHKVGNDRHIYVKIICENCGEEDWERWKRVKEGLGRFCSLECANIGQRKWGREHVYFYFDEIKGRYIARWRDIETGKTRISHKSHFIWEQTHGEIPKGYDVHHKDGDKTNDSLDNLELVEGHLHKQGIHGSNRKVINGVVYKQCFKCKEYYSESGFTAAYCKLCHAEYMREYRRKLK